MADEIFLYTDYLVQNGELPFEDHLRYSENENDFIHLYLDADTRLDLSLVFELACFYNKHRIAKRIINYFRFSFNVCHFISSNHFGDEYSGKDILSFMNCVLQYHKYSSRETIDKYICLCRYFLSYFYEGLPYPFLQLLEKDKLNTSLKELIYEWQNENFVEEIKEPSVD
jgi:hypothetical protein